MPKNNEFYTYSNMYIFNLTNLKLKNKKSLDFSGN